MLPHIALALANLIYPFAKPGSDLGLREFPNKGFKLQTQRFIVLTCARSIEVKFDVMN